MELLRITGIFGLLSLRNISNLKIAVQYGNMSENRNYTIYEPLGVFLVSLKRRTDYTGRDLLLHMMFCTLACKAVT